MAFDAYTLGRDHSRMSDPLAYFLTWTCYGTWLHGDPRGSVDDDHKLHGSPYLSTRRTRRRFEFNHLRQRPVLLDDAARRIVANVIAAHCWHRSWQLLAANVRTNHVHVVVGGCAEAPIERVLSELKAWATRRLRETGRVARATRVWTHHGSTKYLWDPRSVQDAVSYVANGQGEDQRFLRIGPHAV